MSLLHLIKNACSIQFAEVGIAENSSIEEMGINGIYTDILFLQKNQRYVNGHISAT